ncbi:ACP S-malonyltransferase [Legionella rowbothamii]|uniref:ACP S-malonyltransferase n=1 Tax=Legionella rowbothamii TaxID=96229 RepID=UPI001056A261|nr:ACP S-malonyltransferase [Legionella rowbothamii]
MTTYIFPGQGSQSLGMGKNLFNDFTHLINEADEILGYSITQLCLEDPQKMLTNTQYTQPALFTINALSFLKKLQETDKQPDFLMGHSLGEYNALFASGVFDFATGLQIVKKRGELMSAANNGSMAAVIGKNEDEIEQILQESNFNALSIANYNSHTQIVLSGPKHLIDQAGEVFKNRGAFYIPLKVSGAFHSPEMDDVSNQFAEFLQPFIFSAPKTPVIANINAIPYKENNVHYNLTEQINHPVRWTQGVEYLLALGEHNFEEIGPGVVLRGLINRIKKNQ